MRVVTCICDYDCVGDPPRYVKLHSGKCPACDVCENTGKPVSECDCEDCAVTFEEAHPKPNAP